jgi:ATP-dependent RNA helicase DDX3X
MKLPADEFALILGRTARIGNVGLATSFYNDNDEDLAADLVKLLMENDQEIPPFLEPYKPSDANLTFEDDSADSEAEKGRGETGAWAAGSEDAEEENEGDDKGEDGDSAWGQDAEAAESTHEEPVDEQPAAKHTKGRMPAPARQNINKDDVLW